jgi:hypothetical protein
VSTTSKIIGGCLVAWFVGSNVGCGDDEVVPADAAAPPPRQVVEADACSVPDCACASFDDETAIGPLVPEQLGHWAAVHIPLPRGSYEVTEVVVGVTDSSVGASGTGCRRDVAFEVQLFVSDSELPPTDPVVVWTGSPTISDDDAAAAIAFAHAPVDPPVVIAAGDHIFASVHMAGTADAHICLYSCSSVPAEVSDGAWWSNSTAPPYEWETLTASGLAAAYQVGLRGRSVE